MSDKMIRDRIAEYVLNTRGETLPTRIAQPYEMMHFFRRKIVEEAHEINESMGDEELAEELADLLEVIEGMMVHFKLHKAVHQAKQNKFSQRGGFTKGVILEGK